MVSIGKKTNDLIPSLLGLFNQYNNNFKTRMKVDNIFLSFDEKAKKTFNKFINLSNDRFKLMKYGGHLNHILEKQKKNYTKINANILNDLLFNTNFTNDEKKKLVKSVNEFKSKEINSIRDRILEALKERTSIDNMLRERKNNEKSQKIKNIKKISNMLTSKNDKKSRNDRNFLRNKFDLAEQIAKDSIQVDQRRFMAGMEEYKNFLKNKKLMLNTNECKNVNNNKMVKITKKEFKKIERHLNLNNIKLLTYNESNLHRMEVKKNEDEKFNVAYLYKIKNNNDGTLTEYNTRNKKRSLPKLQIKTDTNFPKGKTMIEDTNKDDNNNLYSLTFNNYSNEIKDTIKLVKKEAENGVMIGEKFQSQKKIFDTFYNRHFPYYDDSNILDYIKLIKQKYIFNKGSKDFKRRAQKKLKTMRKVNNERILEDFQRIYEEKKRKWRNEDKEKQIQEKVNAKKEEDNLYFLINLGAKNK